MKSCQHAHVTPGSISSSAEGQDGSWPVLPRRQPITKWVHSADAAIGADLAVLACPVQVWHARCRVIVHNQRRTTWVRHAQPVTQVRHAQWLRGAQWSRRAQP
eukprot:scaffold74254_cov18-Tisochrysis_lutea.AAC.1